ncbi:hypothetical protein Sru01_40350 [Sphaerisporangium rufum]|uniref:DNA-binding transcriptional activator of the SARP family n=1 Tax=Sphaerisporangium rufum TaxID=1381558 RepID=A0A919R4B5_9ACTN|nr:tetratricopeptide repeat protein [Sphaerisporangium rufum]GII79053.1 hypothetical protein Sru01_40350 [Sphaerisporangium rufum]
MRPVETLLGESIRHLRVTAGLTQQELARSAGVSERSLRDIEAGRVGRPRPSSLRRLGAALRLSDEEVETLLSRVRATGRTAHGDRMHISVLGPLNVRRGEAPVGIGAAKQRELLGLLAMQPSQVITRDEIIAVLWDDRPPRTHLNLIQGYVASLRRSLGTAARGPSASVVTSAGGAYRLEVEPGQLDLLGFGDLCLQAKGALVAGHLSSAEELFGEALGCWRGSVLAGSGSALRNHPAAVALDRRRMEIALRFADLALAGGRFQQAVARLHDLLRDEPLHEGLHARLVQAMAGGGEQAAALRLFGDIRSRLAEELGVQPGHELAAAHLRVLRGHPAFPAAPDALTPAPDPPDAGPAAGAPGPAAPPWHAPAPSQSPAGGPPAVGALRAPSAPRPSPADDGRRAPAVRPAVPAQLPFVARGFVGRRDELVRLDAALGGGGHPTIVTLSGTAGVGKTTLAVHWAHRVRDRFPDGQLYLNLRGYSAGRAMEPADAIACFLDALDVPSSRLPPTLEAQVGLFRSLVADRRMLVVLDNAKDAEQVRPLLPGSPGCLVLVTSRDRLPGLVAVEGARPLGLDRLSAAEGRELLAGRLGSDRVAAEPEAVGEIIGRCARLPLALAIVCARAAANAHFPLATLAAELGGALTFLDAFHGGDPTIQPRTVFSWSYRTLSPEAARLFRLMALHPGVDIGLAAAARLADIPEERGRRLLGELVQAHLVDEQRPERYTWHDLLQAYAAERTHEEDAAAERVAAVHRLYEHYRGMTQAAAGLLYPQMVRLPDEVYPSGRSPARFDGPRGAMSWLDAEHLNLYAAVVRAAEDGPRRAGWLIADALRGYLAKRRHSTQWLTVMKGALSAACADADLMGQAAAHLGIAHAYHTTNRQKEATDHLDHLLETSRRAGWMAGEAVAHGNMGTIHGESGRLTASYDCFRQALHIWRHNGSEIYEATVLNNLATLDRYCGRFDAAVGHLERAIAIWRSAGMPAGSPAALNSLGQVYRDLGEFALSAACLRESADLTLETRDLNVHAAALATLSGVHHDLGRMTEALRTADLALRLTGVHSLDRSRCLTYNSYAAACHAVGRYDGALHHYRRSLDLARESGTRHHEAEALIGLSALHMDRGDLEQAHDVTAGALAIAERVRYPVAEGQAFAALAEIHLRRGDPGAAIEHARRAVDVHGRIRHRLGEARALVRLGNAFGHGPDRAPQAAVDHWRQALAIFTDLGTPEADQVRSLIDRAGRPSGAGGGGDDGVVGDRGVVAGEHGLGGGFHDGGVHVG